MVAVSCDSTFAWDFVPVPFRVRLLGKVPHSPQEHFDSVLSEPLSARPACSFILEQRSVTTGGLWGPRGPKGGDGCVREHNSKSLVCSPHGEGIRPILSATGNLLEAGGA